MFCYCGECRDIPPREEYVCLCHGCAETKEGWMEVNLVYCKCNWCGKMAFCHAEKKEKEDA